MSKRTFTEFSTRDSGSISQILDHADALLRAAQALKHDLETLRADSGVEKDVHSVLKRHNERIQSTAKLLSQDEVGSVQFPSQIPQDF